MEVSKNLRIEHNVTLRVLDKSTMKLIREVEGHNSATNTLIEGIGHYLAGASVLRQGFSRLSKYVPQYISLGTMGLISQDEDEDGLPTGISGHVHTGIVAEDFENYIYERPGYGTDGYSKAYNNNRPYFGLGPAYTSFSPTQSYRKNDVVYYNGIAYVATEDMFVNPDNGTYNYWNSDLWVQAPLSMQPNCWELITPSYPRTEISFRDVVPESEAEVPETVDVIFSAMIPTDNFAQFRGNDKDYIFITEAGLWSSKDFDGSAGDSKSSNNLVAGYRLMPSDLIHQFMNPDTMPDEVAIEYLHEQGTDDPTSEEIAQAKIDLANENQQLLKAQVLRVERDQVVQVIWRMQLGNLRNAFGLDSGKLPDGLIQVGDMVYLNVNGAPYGTGVEFPDGGFKILGYYDTEADLESSVTDPEVGDAYGVGTEDPYHLYVYTENDGWFDFGPIGFTAIDSVMSSSSDNPVKNRVIKKYIDDIVGDIPAAIEMLNYIIGMDAITQAIESIDQTIGG